MKKIKVLNYSFENTLINAIIFLILGVVLFTNPGGILKFISYIIGTFLILVGSFNILSYYKTLKRLNLEEKGKLISGIVLIILGLVAMIFSSFIETTIRLICGAWIIYSGVMRLIEALNNKENKNLFIVNMVIAILMIICGFYVLIRTNLIFKFIGLFIILYSVMEIVGYIIYSKKHD